MNKTNRTDRLPRKNASQRHGGFTLIELLVVMAIIAILIARAVVVTICTLAVGCSEDRDRVKLAQQIVKLADLPKPVLDAAQRELPDVKFADAWKNLDEKGDLNSYEIRGRIPESGKIREVRVAPDGTILEKE